jgi:hypothetical protein
MIPGIYILPPFETEIACCIVPQRNEWGSNP